MDRTGAVSVPFGFATLLKHSGQSCCRNRIGVGRRRLLQRHLPSRFASRPKGRWRLGWAPRRQVKERRRTSSARPLGAATGKTVYALHLYVVVGSRRLGRNEGFRFVPIPEYMREATYGLRRIPQPVEKLPRCPLSPQYRAPNTSGFGLFEPDSWSISAQCRLFQQAGVFSEVCIRHCE